MTSIDFNYYLFTIDILKKPSHIMGWCLGEGKCSTGLRISHGHTIGSFSFDKLADQFPEHLSEVYVFNKFHDHAIISFCQTKPDFIKLLTKSLNDGIEPYRSKLAQFYWENYKGTNNKIPLDPLDLVSIYSLYETTDHKHLYYRASPVLLYIEPKQEEKKLSEIEMLDCLNKLKEELGFFHSLKTVFADCATTSFLSPRYNTSVNNTDNTLVFLSDQNLNDEDEFIKFNRFFLEIINYLIANQTLYYFKEKLGNHNTRIDEFLEEGQFLKSKLRKKDIERYQDYHFSILKLRNNFNNLKNQIQNLIPYFKEIDSEIQPALKSRIVEPTKLNTPYPFYDFAYDLSNNTKEALFDVEGLTSIINEKIRQQENFILAYFETINALENIKLQKRVNRLTIIVVVLTIMILLLSQWGEDSVLNLIIKSLKKIF